MIALNSLCNDVAGIKVGQMNILSINLDSAIYTVITEEGDFRDGGCRA